jgi:putative peptide zinc metalloprotease protein
VEAKGTLLAESELAEREKDLADGQAALTLLEAGTRPEELEAQRACLARLEEELRHLEEQQRKQAVITPVPGLVTTAHLKEKVEQFLREGELICLVENPGGLEVEITVPEQDVAKVQLGQTITLKARALAFEKFKVQVERIAPTAGKGEEELQTSVTVHCKLEDPSAELRPGMTGYARIDAGSRPVGQIISDRVVRYLRTEFWW